MTDTPAAGVAVDPETIVTKRTEAALPRLILRVCAFGISFVALSYILDLTYLFEITFYQEQYFGLLYGLVFAAGFIQLPPARRLADRPVALYDYALALVGLAAGLYLFFA